MSHKNSEMQLLPPEAAARLIGFYPTITASDPEIYAAGLVHIFSSYPTHLIAEAVDPGSGLPSLYDFPPTMKQVKEFLEPRHRAEVETNERIARASRKRLPEPPRDPEEGRRIQEGFKKLSEHLGKGFGPSSI